VLRVRLNELLRERGISQRELARRVDKHPDVISRFARQATGAVSYELLSCICGALECDVGDLLEHIPQSRQQIPLFESVEGTVAPSPYWDRRQRVLLRAAEEGPPYGTDQAQPKEEVT